jgi:hypothetical protein
MQNKSLEDHLESFATDNSILNKGSLCVMLVVTRKAKELGRLLDPEDFRTENKGQVAGLGFAAVQAILKDHGINRELAREGGRTSRGSMGNMEKYVALLNELRSDGALDLTETEAFWIKKVRGFFSRSGLKLKYDPSKTLGAAFEDLIQQASKLQEANDGTMYVGPLLHYLVGAKLRLCVDPKLDIRGASVADASSGFSGDYEVGNASIHVTVMPSEEVFRKCSANLSAGLRPMVITLATRIEAARQIAAVMGIHERVEIVDGPQFLAMNLYEKGRFEPSTDKEAFLKLVEIYNEAVSKLESDPAILIK